LRTIGLAHIQATQELDRPPAGKEELLPYLRDLLQQDPDYANPSDIFRSKVDGEEFVIHWNVELRELGRANPRKMPVLAYEKSGKDGKRQVLQFRNTFPATQEELSELPFPPPYKNPF